MVRELFTFFFKEKEIDNANNINEVSQLFFQVWI